MDDNTIKFIVPDDSQTEMKRILTSVYRSLSEKGYNPINQIVGYLLTEDPTYITNYQNARSLICKIDRDELLQELVRNYLFDWRKKPPDVYIRRLFSLNLRDGNQKKLLIFHTIPRNAIGIPDCLHRCAAALGNVPEAAAAGTAHNQ